MKRKNRKRTKKLKRQLVLISFLLVILILTIGKLDILKKPLTAEEITEIIGVSYKIDHIPPSQKRIEKKMIPKYIVVHNTANPDSSAQNERDYLVNPINTDSTSWHIAVDDKEAIEAIPPNETAFHSGDQKGNARGIGIEICESGNYEKAEENAVKIIALLSEHYGIPIKNIKTHEDFSGKACPRKIIDRWDEFKANIKKYKSNIRLQK